MSSSFAPPTFTVELVKGYSSDDKPFYAYILLQTDNVEHFHHALKTQDSILENYGVILAKGEGHEPSQEHSDYIRNRFSK